MTIFGRNKLEFDDDLQPALYKLIDITRCFVNSTTWYWINQIHFLINKLCQYNNLALSLNPDT